MTLSHRSANPAEDAALMERALRLTQGFAPWPAEALERLLARSYVGRHARGARFTAGTGAPGTIAIVSGHALVGRSPAGGQRTVIAFVGPGLVTGLSRIFESSPQVAYDFAAHDDLVAVHMPTQLVLDVLEADPLLWKAMSIMLLRQHLQTLETLLVQSAGSLRQRLCATVERLARLYGHGLGGSLTMRVQVTQEELAAMLQVSRQTINKELHALAATGALSLDYNSITVLNFRTLRRHWQRI